MLQPDVHPEIVRLPRLPTGGASPRGVNIVFRVLPGQLQSTLFAASRSLVPCTRSRTPPAAPPAPSPFRTPHPIRRPVIDVARTNRVDTPIRHTHRAHVRARLHRGRHPDGGCSPVDDACQITTYSISPLLIPVASRAIRSKIARSASALFPATDAIRPPARTAFAAPEYDFNTDPISNTPNTNMNKIGNTIAASTNTAPPSPRDHATTCRSRCLAPSRSCQTSSSSNDVCVRHSQRPRPALEVRRHRSTPSVAPSD